jgi:hypothetical protein
MNIHPDDLAKQLRAIAAENGYSITEIEMKKTKSPAGSDATHSCSFEYVSRCELQSGMEEMLWVPTV